MINYITIYCENTDSELQVEVGSSLAEILNLLPQNTNNNYISAFVNNKSKDLNYLVYEPVNIRYINQTHYEGCKVYARTLFFILYKTIDELYPKSSLIIKHSVSNGYYFEITNTEAYNINVENIKAKMHDIISCDLPIHRKRYKREDVLKLYSEDSLHSKLSIIETNPYLYYTINQLGDKYNFFYGTLAISTSYVKNFDIKEFKDGYYLCMPKNTAPDEIHEMCNRNKLFNVFKEHKKWNEIIKISTVGELNKRIISGDTNAIVEIGEISQQNTFYKVAEEIHSRFADGLKLVLIAGPSSSGKTTSSKKLTLQLQVFGLQPIVIGMDNYFVNREDTPLDENGEKDYETIKSVDISLFNDHLNRLIDGESVNIPSFDFIKGERFYDNTTLKLESNSIIIVEGIHALNPELTEQIDSKHKFKLYVSALTSLSMDNFSFISTTDNRLLRRIVRDNSYRGSSALETLKRWASVKRGEDKNIFPYQEEADLMINTALFYEINVLKRYVEPLLRQVPNTEHVYSEAHRLLHLLKFFTPMDDTYIPHTSIIREFIGGSIFKG